MSAIDRLDTLCDAATRKPLTTERLEALRVFRAAVDRAGYWLVQLAKSERDLRRAVCSRQGCNGENHVEDCPVLAAADDVQSVYNHLDALDLGAPES